MKTMFNIAWAWLYAIMTYCLIKLINSPLLNSATSFVTAIILYVMLAFGIIAIMINMQAEMQKEMQNEVQTN